MPSDQSTTSQGLTRTQHLGAAFGLYTLVFMGIVVHRALLFTGPAKDQPPELTVAGLALFVLSLAPAWFGAGQLVQATIGYRGGADA